MRPFWSIKDARGVTRPVGVTLASAWRGVPSHFKIIFALWAAAMAVFVIAAATWTRLVLRAPHPFPRTTFFVIGAYALMTITGIAGMLRQIRGFAQRAGAEQLKLHRCPTCGYSLEGIAPDDRNLRTCPECSAAWELPPPAIGCACNTRVRL
jgi:hypothetical protein